MDASITPLSGKWKSLSDTTTFLTLNVDHTWSLENKDQIANAGTYRIPNIQSSPGGLINLDLVDKNGNNNMVYHRISNDTLYISSVLLTNKHTVNIFVKQPSLN